MKLGGKRIFSDSRYLKEMLYLRSLGWSYFSLADKYYCHHTSIIHRCNKHEVVPGSPVPYAWAPPIQPPARKDDSKYPEPTINLGKTSYAEYLRADRVRRLPPKIRKLSGFMV